LPKKPWALGKRVDLLKKLYHHRQLLAMARDERLRHLAAAAVVASALIVALAENSAGAPDATPEVQSTEAVCPDVERVWSSVTKLVPSAAAELLAAKPRVDIVDLGESYRVRVSTDAGVLERTYSDPARECEKRTRFAAEFIVVALLPPQLAFPGQPPVDGSSGASGDAGAGDSGTVPIKAPTVAVPPPTSAPAPPSSAQRPSVVCIETSGVGALSPGILAAPLLFAWGGELRVRIGRGQLAGVVAVGYVPEQSFDVGGVRAALMRVPAMGGLRLRWLKRGFELGGDFGLAAAFEHYDGVSPHVALGASRVTPGLEASFVASRAIAFGMGAFVRLQCDWLPFAQELVALPQGDLGKTPSLWLGVGAGLSLDL
jgi:hypothetical protein